MSRSPVLAMITDPRRFGLELTAIGMAIGALGYVFAGWLF